jgi:hypothetical protein
MNDLKYSKEGLKGIQSKNHGLASHTYSKEGLKGNQGLAPHTP